MKQNYPTQRVIVYVDGFNFYYGIKKKPWNKYYWGSSRKHGAYVKLGN